VGRAIPEHVGLLRTRAPLPIEQVLGVEHDSPLYNEADRRTAFYAQSWALVHYLLGKGNSDERRARAGNFLDRLQQGQALEPAFSGAFGMPFEAMEKELRDYVARGQFPVAHISFSDKFKVDTSSRTSPLSRDDALARLGGLLLALGPERHADAEAHFREALRLNPANGLAFMGLGNLLADQGRLEEAVGCFEKASLLLPDDPLLCYHHARALLGHSSAPAAAGPAGNAPPAEILARARSLLARATQLRPQFAPAYAELGWSYAAAAGEVGEGSAALEKARELVPSRLDVAANLFSLYLRAGQAGKARAMYEKILVPAGNRQVIEWARLALEQEQAVRPATGDSGGTDDGPAAGAAMPPAADRTILVIEQAAEEATDLEKKQRLQEIAEALKQDTPSVVFNEQVRVLNEAVALANRLDYAGAIAIVEKVLPSIQEHELRKQAEQMLARLRQDEQKQRGQRK